MSRIRRIFEKDLKAKVVLDLKEKDTIMVLAKKNTSCFPTQFQHGVRGHKNLAAVLIRKTVILKDEVQQRLHAQ
jgi:hypothetical protein